MADNAPSTVYAGAKRPAGYEAGKGYGTGRKGAIGAGSRKAKPQRKRRTIAHGGSAK